MISRRNIRVKVMQLIYALETMDDTQKKTDPVKQLQKLLDQSRELFVYLLYTITEVARYSETDAHLRASRNLPSEADKNVNVRISGNSFLWKIVEDANFQKAIETDKPNLQLEKSMVKRMYNELIETPEYKQYISLAERDKKSEKDIIQFIFTELLLPSEFYISHVEELYTNWDDDAEMMRQLILNYLQKPSAYNISEMVSNEKWIYARTLLTTVLDKKDHLLELIKPKLKNWDADRIAQLDMIVMEMGIAELLYFETIPPKVTINEYIDIAKEYSTAQSGQFVNGILDGVHKELVAENKIHKVDFKKAK
jgi:N utilization substance protein B